MQLTSTDAVAGTGSDASWAEGRWALPVLLAAHVVAWTVYSIIAQSAGAVHHDMTEAWSWGQEFRLGYYKHPPLYAWVSGLWFHIMPRADWAYYLLSQLNAAIGLAGVWMLAGRLLGSRERIAAVLLWGLTPFVTIMAINFNANAMLLSLWPWTAYAFVRAIETGKARDGVFFGAMAAACMMSKYFSVLLLASCFAASLLHPRFRDIYRSPAPYVAVATALVLLSPHIAWMVANDWQTIEYASHKTGFAGGLVAYKTSTTAVSSLLLLGPPALALMVAFGWRETVQLHASAIARAFQRSTAWIAVLAIGPFLLTLLAGPLGSVKISTNFMIPVLFMIPTALLALSRTMFDAQRFKVLTRAAVIYPLGAILLSPAIAYVLFDRQIDLAAEPRKELAQIVTHEWRGLTKQPLRLVAGTNAYGTGMVFYSPDSPHEFTRLNYSQAPWVTQERLQREGLAVACLDIDLDCIAKTSALVIAGSRRMQLSLTRTFLGMQAPPRTFEIFLIPPGPIPHVPEPMQHRN